MNPPGFGVKRRYLKKKFGEKLSKLVFMAYKKARREMYGAYGTCPSAYDILNFAKKWLEQWKEIAISSDSECDLFVMTCQLCGELVRRTFSARDIVTERISPGLVETIAKNITCGLGKIKEELYSVVEREMPKKRRYSAVDSHRVAKSRFSAKEAEENKTDKTVVLPEPQKPKVTFLKIEDVPAPLVLENLPAKSDAQPCCYCGKTSVVSSKEKHYCAKCFASKK